ncbi:MAG TPA: hypothetical protein ENK06_06060, partial [Gammaproteobacteria bacterium]|nr:hypothetical protein [Gammaproteobacteria bacterium]
MELNKAANRLFVLMAFFVGFYCKAVSAEVVYFDGFDGATVEPIAPWPVGGSPDPEANWITI